MIEVFEDEVGWQLPRIAVINAREGSLPMKL
jgi:hypothetical protein